VVASFSGAPGHPSWYLNLSDRDANPEVKIRVQQGLFWADPQVLDGSDYADTWAGLTADRPWYDDYQSRTDRRIPLVRLVELRSA
jgi:deazaflavin-dependent oxidoreductase (nitroreductase family)